MRRKRLNEADNIIFKNNNISIIKDLEDQYVYEIGNEITYDVGEAVAIMIGDNSKNLWDIDIKVKLTDISPEKTLYWMSGGNKEWKTLEHYNRQWTDCYLDFLEEYGYVIINILRKSKKLIDIKRGFQKHINLPTMYDFAISKGFVK